MQVHVIDQLTQDVTEIQSQMLSTGVKPTPLVFAKAVHDFGVLRGLRTESDDITYDHDMEYCVKLGEAEFTVKQNWQGAIEWNIQLRKLIKG